MPWFSRLEEQAAARAAALEARIEKLETRLMVAHDASVEAVGLLAGQLVARLEEQVAGIESSIGARHERLVAQIEASLGERNAELLVRLDADRSATVEALRALAPAQQVDRLLEGVVALGEVLDADLVNLRRLIAEGPGVLGPAAAEHDDAAGRELGDLDAGADGADEEEPPA